MITKIILQDISNIEARTVIAGVAIHKNNIQIIRSSIADIENHIAVNAMPVGSVEFCRKYMNLAKLVEPKFSAYPIELKDFLHRGIVIVSVKEFLSIIETNLFVKPVKTKLFNGFVFNGWHTAYDEHDQEQIDILKRLPDDEKLIISNKVNFVSEWRYYIDSVAHGYDIIGSARYDPLGEDDAASPDIEVIKHAISLMPNNHPYVLDFGVLDTGQTALVEANDAWAIGFYRKSMNAIDYVQFLINRWRILCAMN